MFEEQYRYRKPISNKYVVTEDCGSVMLECPKCECRICSFPFSYAVGNKGYSFCPYCGEDLRKQEQMSIFDWMGDEK